MEALGQILFRVVVLDYGVSAILQEGRPCGSSYSNKSLIHGSRLRFSRKKAPVFTDQSHVGFYTNIVCGKKESAKSSFARGAHQGLIPCDFSRWNDAATQDFLQKLDEINAHLGIKDKKRRETANDRVSSCRANTSSSSSSSSESESDVTKMRSRKGRQHYRRTYESIQREFETVSSSPIFKSVPIHSEICTVQDPAVEGLTPTRSELSHRREYLNRLSSPVTYTSSTHFPSESSSSSTCKSSRNADCMQQTDSTGLLNSKTVSVYSMNTLAGLAVVSDFADVYVAVPTEPVLSRVEVCMGGKCKKNGAQEILSAFQNRMPGGNVSACTKCMKNCKAAVNVRVQKDGTTNPQIHSSVGVEDVDTILREHLGAGATYSRLHSRSFSSIGR